MKKEKKDNRTRSLYISYMYIDCIDSMIVMTMYIHDILLEY